MRAWIRRSVSGELIPLPALQVGSSRADVGDAHIDLVGRHPDDEPADLAVVEPYPLARLGLPENLGEGAADAVLAATGGGCGGFEGASESQAIPAVDAVGLLDLSSFADRDDVLVDCRRADDLEACAYISGLRRGHQTTIGSGLDDHPMPDGVTAVDKFESVARTPARASPRRPREGPVARGGGAARPRSAVSHASAGTCTTPRRSRASGEMRTTRGPGSSGPVRSFGPPRSMAMRGR